MRFVFLFLHIHCWVLSSILVSGWRTWRLFSGLKYFLKSFWIPYSIDLTETETLILNSRYQLRIRYYWKLPIDTKWIFYNSRCSTASSSTQIPYFHCCVHALPSQAPRAHHVDRKVDDEPLLSYYAAVAVIPYSSLPRSHHLLCPTYVFAVNAASAIAPKSDTSNAKRRGCLYFLRVCKFASTLENDCNLFR